LERFFHKTIPQRLCKGLKYVQSLRPTNPQRIQGSEEHITFLRHVPLYLEWAPEGILSGDTSAAREAAKKRKDKSGASMVAQMAAEAATKKAVVEKTVPEDEEGLDDQVRGDLVLS
jgi:hypothetical protein